MLKPNNLNQKCLYSYKSKKGPTPDIKCDLIKLYSSGAILRINQVLDKSDLLYITLLREDVQPYRVQKAQITSINGNIYSVEWLGD